MQRYMIMAIACIVSMGSIHAAEGDGPSVPSRQMQAEYNADPAISSNPGVVDRETGTGALGRALGFKPESGIRVGGLWIGDVNYLFHGGVKPRKWSGNNLAQLSLHIDTEKFSNWKGGLFGVECLQFNGRPTNTQAGSVQGYNSLVGPPPRHRCELYQLWFRQELFDQKLTVRIGKMVPQYDFNNVIRPIPIVEKNLNIPSATGLLYTPIFVNPSMLGVLPGYYNSAYGLAATLMPVQSSYLSYGIFDGNLARGKQTGLRGPHFGEYRFQITETGYGWSIGAMKLLGNIGIGAWQQSGKLFATHLAGHRMTEHGARGTYLFGSQRLWRRYQNINSGIIGFWQFGVNNSKTLRMKKSYGAGLTFLGLVPGRLKDSFGFGISWAKLNKNLFVREHELMCQGYYQMHLFQDVFFVSALTYIPHPGAAPNLSAAWAATARIIALF